MARRVGEPVVVRQEESAPTAFLWRGRLYVVREVLGHWREREAWWTTAAARAVHGDGEQGEVAVRDVRLLAPGTRVRLDHEREVWRVEASAGRAFGSGVYDLSRSGTSPAAWHLLRVAD
jgi:hypothetical protein